MIQPTVGRVVHFYHQGRKPGDEPLAATIAKVISERVINVGVLNESGTPFDRQHVQLLQDDDQPPHADYCAWMDYQKGQAAKTEALEQQLAAAGDGNGAASTEQPAGTDTPSQQQPA